MDWAALSDISQTYAAISVPLTAAALLGAVASLTYQARQAKVGHEETRNATHRSLISATLEDPDLRVCWGPPLTPVTATQYRQFVYTNMIISFWHSEYTLGGGAASDAIIRFNATRLFQGAVGREYWASWSSGWRETSFGRKSRRFVHILDEAFEAARALGAPVATSDYFLPEQPAD
ncbi:DUF6082 family protein [Streptomyces sp. NPDC093675]|uniref:DUF6082 family protein n=1 Tax=Streptomyces sp. NPDC093675 TaxID=3366049 RepID=UPI0037F5453F